MNIEKIRNAWSKETCHPSYANKWTKENPSAGQCAITALYLNRECGYPIYDVMIGRQRHFFNRDKNDNVVDLTSDQFGDKTIPYEEGRLRNPNDVMKSTKDRYEIFRKNMHENFDPYQIRHPFINEAYLDDAHEFYDFRTKDVSNGEYIDTTTTGVPHYNSILSAMENGESYENLTGEIVYMSPEEYYKECATKIFFRSTVDSLKLSRGEADREIIEHLKQVILRFGKRFPLPFINYAARSQEGLHRMLALAELTSWDTKFPVLIVRYADEELARREETQREINNITHKIRMAARDALMYKFYNYEEFKEQLQWSMDKEWQFSDEGTPKYDIIDLNDCFRIAIGEAYYDVDKEDIKIVEPEPNDDLDDVDLDDIEDFLIRHFGDDWEKDFPHLKDTFNLNEELNNDAIEDVLSELSNFDYAFIDGDGNELDDEEAMKAVVQSPDQLKDLGKGVCTDFVEYTRTKLDEREIPYKVYDITCTDKDGDRPSHVFVVVENKGKFLWIEAAWHSEAGIHEYDSLEELFEDIARKHCIYDGENYLKSCEIREIKKSLVGMSQEAIYNYVGTLPITWKAVEEGITEELEATQAANIEAMNKAIQEHFGQDSPGDGCIFIAPNGKFLNIYPELDDHEDLAYWLQEQGFEEVIEEAEWFVESFSYVRCRNSLSQCFIELPIKTITKYQLYSLEEWLETKVNTPTLDVEAPNGEWKNYDLDEYFPEDIIKLIKRCYASGRLYESQAQIGYLPVSDVELFKEYADDILDGYGGLSDSDIKRDIKEIHIDGKLAGYIGFSEYEENGSKCLGIGNFMIIERGKGLGSAVIQDIVEKYKNHYDLIYCFVDAKNDGAIRFYKTLGKVYDEDGPNDNGEYYVTFWDNGKWDLDEKFDSSDSSSTSVQFIYPPEEDDLDDLDFGSNDNFLITYKIGE